MKNDRKFDVILFGATGYTGHLVATYLANAHQGEGIRFAIAGRDEEKLNRLKREPGLEHLEVVLANAMDPASIRDLVLQTRVLISAVGPYQIHGNAVADACAHHGTDYVDLCGEPIWIAEKIEALHAVAKKSGARIVFSCGFDSVPFDLGVYFLQMIAIERFKSPCATVRGRVRAFKGWVSGGTVASAMAEAMAKKADDAKRLVAKNPFAWTKPFEGPAQPDISKPYLDELVGSFVVPFMMASINTKSVHRTNFLLNHMYTKEFRYDEMLMVKDLDHQPVLFQSEVHPEPGEGPTREQRESGFYDLLFVGEHKNNTRIKVSVKGDMDPGYGSTSKILAESAMCLAFDVKEEEVRGGCLTPASAMGEFLIHRLRTFAGVEFKVEE